MRFLGDLRQEDFKSPEIYQCFDKKYKQLTKNVRNLKDQKSRLVIKVEKLEKCFVDLRNNGLLSKDALESIQVNIFYTYQFIFMKIMHLRNSLSLSFTNTNSFNKYH